ncbi:hypothetical protein PWT90_09969 [Aphanocladium album]|nr:hypothetical protein PWT90_09969 [Aphanocladium album]
MADSSMNLLYTVGGYAALFGAGYTVYHFSTKSEAKRRAAAAKAKAAQPEVRKEDRKKKQRMEAFAQEAQSASKAAHNAPPEVKEPQASVSTGRDTMDDSAANREFAKQLSKAQEGTKFAARSDAKQREKSVKQSKAVEIDGAKATKAAAPAAPAAPAARVEPEAAQAEESAEEETAAAPAEAGRVDDMLEPKAAAPTVLRLGESKSTEQKKKKETKPVEKTETKKQRQNRKKAEAAKAAREGAETERKALEEKQRRQARVAEGRAAKDGSQFTNGAAAAWKQGAPNGAPKTNGDLHAPLDTFESAAPAKINGTTPVVVEQPAQQDEGEWNTVKTKSSKKKAAAVSNSDNEEPAAAAAAAAPKAAPVTKQPAPQANTNGGSTKKAFGGSFSALTTNDDIDEEEQEWDVSSRSAN